MLRPGRGTHKLVAEHSDGDAAACHRLVDGRGADLPVGGQPSRLVQRAAPFCGSSKTSEHNFVFLKGEPPALTGGEGFKGGL